MVEYIIGFYCTLTFVWVTINRNKLSRHASMSVKQQICKNALTLTLNWTCCKNSIFLPSSSIEDESSVHFNFIVSHQCDGLNWIQFVCSAVVVLYACQQGKRNNTKLREVVLLMLQEAVFLHSGI